MIIGHLEPRGSRQLMKSLEVVIEVDLLRIINESGTFECNKKVPFTITSGPSTILTLIGVSFTMIIPSSMTVIGAKSLDVEQSTFHPMDGTIHPNMRDEKISNLLTC